MSFGGRECRGHCGPPIHIDPDVFERPHVKEMACQSLNERLAEEAKGRVVKRAEKALLGAIASRMRRACFMPLSPAQGSICGLEIGRITRIRPARWIAIRIAGELVEKAVRIQIERQDSKICDTRDNRLQEPSASGH